MPKVIKKQQHLYWELSHFHCWSDTVALYYLASSPFCYIAFLIIVCIVLGIQYPDKSLYNFQKQLKKKRDYRRLCQEYLYKMLSVTAGEQTAAVWKSHPGLHQSPSVLWTARSAGDNCVSSSLQFHINIHGYRTAEPQLDQLIIVFTSCTLSLTLFTSRLKSHLFVQ